MSPIFGREKRSIRSLSYRTEPNRNRTVTSSNRDSCHSDSRLNLTTKIIGVNSQKFLALTWTSMLSNLEVVSFIIQPHRFSEFVWTENNNERFCEHNRMVYFLPYHLDNMQYFHNLYPIRLPRNNSQRIQFQFPIPQSVRLFRNHPQQNRASKTIFEQSNFEFHPTKNTRFEQSHSWQSPYSPISKQSHEKIFLLKPIRYPPYQCLVNARIKKTFTDCEGGQKKTFLWRFPNIHE